MNTSHPHDDIHFGLGGIQQAPDEPAHFLGDLMQSDPFYGDPSKRGSIKINNLSVDIEGNGEDD